MQDTKHEPMPELKKGHAYLILERTPQKSYELFKKFLKDGYSGIVITRTFPKRILEDYSFDTSEIYWLSKTYNNGQIDPNDLVQLSHKIRIFIEKHENAIIILDGIEYLITQNNFNTILKFIQVINEYVSSKSAILIIPTSPFALSQSEIGMLEREVKLIDSSA